MLSFPTTGLFQSFQSSPFPPKPFISHTSQTYFPPTLSLHCSNPADTLLAALHRVQQATLQLRQASDSPRYRQTKLIYEKYAHIYKRKREKSKHVTTKRAKRVQMTLEDFVIRS